MKCNPTSNSTILIKISFKSSFTAYFIGSFFPAVFTGGRRGGERTGEGGGLWNCSLSSGCVEGSRGGAQQTEAAKVRGGGDMDTLHPYMHVP